MALTGKQVRHLRGLAHHLKPVVTVGAAGLSEPVIKQVREALEAHELIKVRFGDNAEAGARDAANELAERSGAHLAQVIGHIAVLYKARKDEPEIQLPR